MLRKTPTLTSAGTLNAPQVQGRFRVRFAASAAALLVFATWTARAPACAAQSNPSSATATITGCPHCPITKQLSVGKSFDTSQTEFLTDPKAFVIEGRRDELQVIARVLSPSPLIIEILDTEPSSSYEFDNCGIRVIPSIDAKLKAAVAKLQYNELIKARILYGVVLADVTVIHGSPVYYHAEAGKDICANRTGVLIVYRGHGPQLVIVYNDGSLYYCGATFKSFHRQKLTGEELEELLNFFAKTNFDALPSSVPPFDKQEEPSISLICSRFQNVPVRGHEAELAPLIARLEQLKLKAMSQTYYLLHYKDKREIHLMPWPYSQVPLAQLEKYKLRGDSQQRFGKNPRDPEDYSVVFQKIPQEFLEHLPGAFKPDDPNRDVYFSDDGKVFRVEYELSETNERRYGGFDTLRAGEVVTPDDVLKGRKQDFENPGLGAFYRGFIGAWFWPTDVSVHLSELPEDGRVIDAEEFERHKAFYFELLVAGGPTCEYGVVFLEKDYKYEGVSICQKELPSQ